MSEAKRSCEEERWDQISGTSPLYQWDLRKLSWTTVSQIWNSFGSIRSANIRLSSPIHNILHCLFDFTWVILCRRSKGNCPVVSCVQRWRLRLGTSPVPAVPAERREPQGIVAVNWHLGGLVFCGCHSARQVTMGRQGPQLPCRGRGWLCGLTGLTLLGWACNWGERNPEVQATPKSLSV